MMVLTCLGLPVCRVSTPLVTVLVSPYKNLTRRYQQVLPQSSLLEQFVFEEKKRACLFPPTLEGTSGDIATYQEARTSLESTA